MTAIRIHSDTEHKHKRVTKRLDLRKGDGIVALISSSSTEKVEAEIFDISPFGASVKINKAFVTTHLGESLSFEIKFHDEKVVSYFCEVIWKREDDTYLKLGLIYKEQLSPMPSVLPLDKESFPVAVPVFFHFTGVVYKPYLFFERSLISITHFSAQLWQCEFFDSEMILFKGMKFDLWLLNFESDKNRIGVEVVQFHSGSDGRLVVQLRVLAISNRISMWIAHQLVLNCNFSPLQIRRLGFETKEFSNGFRFRFVKSKEEYELVLKLRYKAYLAAGKIDKSKTWVDMQASMDHLSRILVAYHGEKLVASIAISYPDREDCVLDTEKGFPSGYPQPVPSKLEIVEISRLCTDSEYRRTDLLNRIFEYTYKSVLCGDRKYILTSTDSKLWTLYRKLGFKKTGMSYPHPYLSGIEHFIIIGKRTQPDKGEQISPLAWNYLWREMNDFMSDRQFLSYNILEYGRIIFYKIIGKILKIQQKKFY